MPILPREQTALAAISNQSSNQGYRPRLIEFYGYEGEDFRHFQEILESYLAISNTNSDGRKLVILKSQLRRAAKVYFERVILKNKPDITYDQAIEELKKQYITPELIQNYELEFSEMYQGNQEHPRIFLARLREAADLANIDNEAIIEIAPETFKNGSTTQMVGGMPIDPEKSLWSTIHSYHATSTML
ncbi:hypothetical protein G6F46_013423 [Rhizopus delemar]|uniref:Uncharacterized protein n=2 Tax=Rhizopus TaxID=4842 RepID=A0A9P6Y4Z7_9FUNG|nr:hypothetical protein G6F53_013312 [Rhizopus delemar]KAG1530956.1 hypothetical protein G6F51_013673 [Rhizopus arrhizus]KAG1539499.1 hypothetical protein G6F50_014494 [Rhizopus delemar]KAG1605848.1 hypothetical protein G6F46_013423 [Rhizopus delemar]